MNILLLGNGFDLEHNLPTSYNDFLNFCERVNVIFTYPAETTSETYQRKFLDGWKTDDSIKKALLAAFRGRYSDPTVQSEKFWTDYRELNEIYTYTESNPWLNYFIERRNGLGKNWIDFEAEISNVVQSLDGVRTHLKSKSVLTSYSENDSTIPVSLWKLDGRTFKSAFGSISSLEDFIADLSTRLEHFIRALEIYISAFVGRIDITKRSSDIESLNPDHVLSFNYSDTYERTYGSGKNIEYDYIHGKADSNKSLATCNLVLGIDEKPGTNYQDSDFTFLPFKKFYQRIYKSTGNAYLEWVDEIKDGYASYVKKEADIYSQVVDAIKDGSLAQYPAASNSFIELSNVGCPQHTLYIFGHSLDVTDVDVLKLFICNENVQTKIFYYRKYENDKETLGRLIRNLLRILGPDELVRRTGGAHKTIEFIPQALSEDEWVPTTSTFGAS